ncbi:MAG: XdhC family protein [Deltaproteobacteria bacterium]|nr:XdhC family protein [Deltaproteobacteria bacterium]
MKDLRDIVEAWRKSVVESAAVPRESAVLATVVRSEGSTYRRPGAHLLVLPDDEMVGLIGGGCLEGDLLEQARRVRISGEPRSVLYDSRSEDDIVWGLGLGCAGKVEILLEPAGDDRQGPIAFIEGCLAERRPGLLGTVISSGDALAGADRPALGSHCSAREEGGMLCFAPGDLRGPFALRVEQEAKEAWRRLFLSSNPANPADRAGAPRASQRMVAYGGGRVELLFEAVLPLPRLLVFGAGPDALPVVTLAAELGFEVTVVDGREAYARADRFPDDVGVVCCDPADARELSKRLEVDAESVALVMNHHYLRDRDALRWLLDRPLLYLGALGPKRRSEDLLRDLRDEGLAIDEAALAHFHAPAGLDIGSESPEEIALSLLAEIRAVLAGRSGGSLRERAGPIHDSPPRGSPPGDSPPRGSPPGGSGSS